MWTVKRDACLHLSTAMPIPELPLECLQLIIVELFRNHDTPTLSSLLRVNKRFCAATLPFLYADPFRRELHEVRAPLARREASESGMKIVKLLLRHAEPESVTGLLLAAYGDGKDAGTKPESSGINYLEYLRHFFSPELEPLPGFIFRNRHLLENTVLCGYMSQTGLDTTFRSQELDIEHNPYASPEQVLQPYLSVNLRVQLTWALCNPVLENIQSMVIPLSDIHSYNAVVHRFSSLKDVLFKLDEKLVYPEYVNRSMQDQLPGWNDHKERKRVQTLEAMLGFVRTHTRLFPHQLRAASCPDDSNWSGARQRCPDAFQAQLQDLLPPFVVPKVVESESWSQFLAKIDAADLDHVEVIRAPSNDPNQWYMYPSFDDHRVNFLQRCRRLRELEMVSLGADTFEWAAKEAVDRVIALINQQAAEESGQVGTTPIPRLPSAVPLEHVRLWTHWDPLEDEVRDLLRAFSETLVSVSVLGIPRPVVSIVPRSKTVLLDVYTDECPRLKKAIFVMPENRLELTAQFLRRSPELEHLEVKDKFMHYSCSEVLSQGATGYRNWIPCKEMRLKVLKLQGWTALKSFHPMSLRFMPHLMILQLGVKCENGQRFIPHVEDLLRHEYSSVEEEVQVEDAIHACEWHNIGLHHEDPNIATTEYQPKRPFWSWDWDLPRLQALELTGEFAWRFQFKMLAGCPSLETLVLNMATIGDSDMVVEPDQSSTSCRATHRQQPEVFDHQRTIRIQHFLKRGKDEGHAATSGQEPYIEALNLKTLFLYGRWKLPDDVLLLMMQSVMPNLRDLTESQCLGFTIEGWLRATDRPSRLQNASSTRVVREDRLVELGLENYLPDLSRESVVRIKEELIKGELQRKMVLVPADEPGSGIGEAQAPRVMYSFNYGTHYVKSDTASQ